MSEPNEPAPAAWPPWVQDWILPYLDDSILWPVLFALLGHVLLIIVPFLLQVWRYANPGAGIILVILMFGSGHLVHMELQAIGKPRGLTAVLVLMWLAALPCAWFAETTGVL